MLPFSNIEEEIIKSVLICNMRIIVTEKGQDLRRALIREALSLEALLPPLGKDREEHTKLGQLLSPLSA